MSAVLAALGWIVFSLAVFAGLVLDMVGLFGNWVILAALACVWILTGFQHFGIWAMVGCVGLAVLGEVLETLAAGYGAAKFGGSRGAIISALIGCIAGAILGTPMFPVIGTLIGACLGAFAGATAHEIVLMRKSASQAAWTGLGAALGKVAGMMAKLLMGLGMLLVAALTY